MRNENDEDSDESTKLHRKVTEWLQTEGYPTEYRAANVFRKSHFHVIQGGYVGTSTGSEKDTKRELDVVASMATRDDDDGFFLRVSHLVECKWSKNKPWVIFTSPETRMAPSACVAQTIGSLLGESILWTMAGEVPLHRLDLFATPPLGGFGGRQALTTGYDHFYSALKGVVENSYAHVAAADKMPRRKGQCPTFSEIVFPVVVVEGRLFKASFDEAVNDMRLEETEHVRCHWRGSVAAVAHATVDIVTLESLNDFVAKRSLETRTFLELMRPVALQIAECAKEKSLSGLKYKSVPRGIVGLPRLLREIYAASKSEEGLGSQ